jgi:hypothetical protein
MIEFINTSTSIVEADLDAVEQRFGFIFPCEIREHYLRANGGQPTRNRFINAERICVVHDFLPIKASVIPTLKTLETHLKWLKIDQQVVPAHLVPFATDPFGNFYCFSVRERDYGAIYWLKMEGECRPEGDLLAVSLNAFLDELKAKGQELPTNKGNG